VECPFCHGEQSDVVDSRTTIDSIRRRRICKDCKRRFTTYETVGSPNLRVIKRGQRKPEHFSTAKLRVTLLRVCRRRPVREADIDAMVSQIYAELSQTRSIESGDLARIVIERLSALDRVSGDRLAASYLDEGGQLRFDHREPDGEPTEQLPLFTDDDSE
jgi:transcriptional repressor NrdR